VVSSEDRRVLRRRPDGELEFYADFAHIAGGRGNDMIVTTAGQCYVGNFGFERGKDAPRSARLAHIDRERRVNPVEGELAFPNGMVVDGETLIVAETYAHRLTAFKIDDDGGLIRPQVWARLGDDQHPDGIALDSDGGVWYANAQTTGDTSGFYRVEEGGRITDRIAIDGAWAVACTFGGEDLSELYVLCARTSLEDFYAGRSDGFVGRANVGRRGVTGSQ
jgi:sugar lactone lactonase YvrE